MTGGSPSNAVFWELMRLRDELAHPHPQSFIAGYRIRYVELETVCAWLQDNGWAGGIGFDEAVKAMADGPDIDVERLRRAMSRVAAGNHARRIYNGPKAAAAIAAAYADLGNRER